MKVLIVDDSNFITKTIQRIIYSEHQDWECDVANSAEDALSLIASADYDYLTVDYNMPGENGTAVIHEAKKRYPSARIALLTANKQQAMLDRAAMLGVTFIPKPDFSEALIEFLNIESGSTV